MSADLFASIPPQVQVGEHRQTLNVDVRALGAGRVSVSLKQPGEARALKTSHSADTDEDVLLTIARMANELRPTLEAQHRAKMRAMGYA